VQSHFPHFAVEISLTVSSSDFSGVLEHDSLGYRTSFTFGPAGQQIGTENGLGRRSSSVLDPTGRVSAGINPLGNQTTFSYAPAGQQVAVDDSFDARTTNLYNAEGQVSASVNSLGSRSSFVFDAEGRSVARVNPLGARVTSLFDAAGQMVAMLNPLGFRTSFGFDAAGRQVVTTAPRDIPTFESCQACKTGLPNQGSLDCDNFKGMGSWYSALGEGD
jgi:YD repeat-containing protein